MNIIRKMSLQLSDRTFERIENRIDGFKSGLFATLTAGAYLLWNTDKYVELKNENNERKIQMIKNENDKQIEMIKNDNDKKLNELQEQINFLKNRKFLW